MVYESTGLQSKERLEVVKTVAQQTAKHLNMDFGIVNFGKTGVPLYIYYECGDDEEPVPLYCDEGKIAGLKEISSVLCNMMFVLSFHPRHNVLRQMRSEIVKLS